jgi:tetratricopeptide (TPR) repeat protein
MLFGIFILLSACMSPLEQAIFDGNKAFDNQKWDEAIAKYSEAIKLDPNNVMAYTNRGAAYTEKQNYTYALLDYTKAVELDPKNYFPLYNRSMLYIKMGDQDKAIADCDTIINTLDLQYHWVYYNRGVAYTKKQMYDNAIADFQKSMTLTDDATFKKTVQDAIKQIQTAVPK